MEAVYNSTLVVKTDFKLKENTSNGIIQQVHHTIHGQNGHVHRIRFVAAAFSGPTEVLACVDRDGNMFVLDFTSLKFWKLPSVGLCSAMKFIPYLRNIAVVGLNDENHEVRFVDVDTGDILTSLEGHTSAVKHIAFSTSNTGFMITASPMEAIIWETRNYKMIFNLSAANLAIEQITFSPVTDNIVALFRNNVVQVWRPETMKFHRQIIANDVKYLKTIAFTTNGRAMVMGGLSPLLILFSLDTWKALKTVNLTKFGVSGIKQLEFVPQAFDGGCNKILALLSNNCKLQILDMETLSVIHTISPDFSNIKTIVVCPSGKYLACLLKLGEVNIYNSSLIMNIANHVKGDFGGSQKRPGKSVKSQPRKIFPPYKILSREAVDDKIKSSLDITRMRKLLVQYGEYPEQYRKIIWRSLLDTPRNSNAFSSLLDKPIHPLFENLEKDFIIHSTTTMNNLKKILSCLSYWCPLFANMPFLPGFVFPFVRVLQKDLLLTFEVVATVLVSYCQLWFDYAPFPPINILAMIENILGESDNQILKRFCEYSITSQTYALPLLETAFSEILSSKEWLIVWDHVLSNEPAFLLMVPVAYSVTQRTALRKMDKLLHFDEFYHTQNPIDMKTFIKNCYKLLNNTSDEIHPRQYLKEYTPLEKGDCYAPFNGYPRVTLNIKVNKKKSGNLEEVGDKQSLQELMSRSQHAEILRREKLKEKQMFASASASDSSSASDIHSKKVQT